MEERIERRMSAEGYDLQSDEGATEFQRRLDRATEQAKTTTVRRPGARTKKPAPKLNGIAV